MLLPSLKKKYLSYETFSRAKFKDFFSTETLQKSLIYNATLLETVYIENKGSLNFEIKTLPKQIQLSTVNAFLVEDFNKDGNLDLMGGGNFFRSNIQMGRYDASYGNILLGNGKGGFKALSSAESGISITGETRFLKRMVISNKICYLAAQNNDSIKFFTKSERVARKH